MSDTTDTIETLQALLAAVLAREAATTARYDERVAKLEARAAKLLEALAPLRRIADAYDSSNLDDERGRVSSLHRWPPSHTWSLPCCTTVDGGVTTSDRNWRG